MEYVFLILSLEIRVFSDDIANMNDSILDGGGLLLLLLRSLVQ